MLLFLFRLCAVLLYMCYLLIDGLRIIHMLVIIHGTAGCLGGYHHIQTSITELCDADQTTAGLWGIAAFSPTDRTAGKAGFAALQQ